jgi:hypothetical protein
VENVCSINGSSERAMMHIVRIANIRHGLVESDNLIIAQMCNVML